MASGSNRHLILALSSKGFGEGLLGLNLARDLLSQGHEVFFLAHESNEKLFQTGIPHMTFSSETGSLLKLYIRMCLTNFRATSIILADYLSTMLFCEDAGVDLGMLTSLGIPVAAIDTWDSTRSPDHIDLFVDGFDRTVPRLPGEVMSICPVPFLAPHKNSRFYGSLPMRTIPRHRGSNSARKRLGLPQDAKVVLFCTAEWQHPGPFPVRARKGSARHDWYLKQWDMSRRLSESVPELLAEYLMRLGRQVHLVHVGPQAFALQQSLEGRYHWRPPMPPGEFDQLLSGMDLLVTANISATTISKAMVYEIPVMVLQNQAMVASRQDAEEQMEEAPSPGLRAWLERSAPFYPFALWPLGYHRFVAPLLQDNPYTQALGVVEMLHERRVEATLHELLFDATARAEQAHRQAAYVSHVRSLPSGAELVKATLG